MDQELIDKLNQGIPLESSGTILPWKTNWNHLQNFGAPTYAKLSEQREDYVWKDERILNGLTTNLTVMKWRTLFNFQHHLRFAFGYISKSEFEENIVQLNTLLGQQAIFKRLNKLEHRYTWKLSNYKIILTGAHIAQRHAC